MSSFQGVEIEGSTVYRGVLISGCWGSTVYRGVLISGCWNREGSTVYRGVLISGGWNRGFHCIQRCLHFRELE